jgi:uncharacterized protein (DUF3084 family)
MTEDITTDERSTGHRPWWRQLLVPVAVGVIAFSLGASATANDDATTSDEYKSLDEKFAATSIDLDDDNQIVADLESKLAAAEDAVSALESDKERQEADADRRQTRLDDRAAKLDKREAGLNELESDLETRAAELDSLGKELDDKEAELGKQERASTQTNDDPPPVEEEPDDEPAEVYYKNCDAVRAAGKAPLHRGEPGYASHLDRDNDGIACE